MTNQRELKLGIQYRLATIELRQPETREDGQTQEEDRRFTFSCSSEEPFERYWGVEILGHDAANVRMDWIASGNAPLLLDHNPSKQIGIIESAYLKDGRLYVDARFGKGELATEIFNDVKDGIRKNISVGYQIFEVKSEQPPTEDKPAVYRVIDWKPVEASQVAIPADETIGHGRDAQKFPVTIMQTHPTKENTMTNPAAAEPQAGARDSELAKKQKSRIDEILALGKKHDCYEKAAEFIREDKSVDEFKDFIIEKLGKNPDSQTFRGKSQESLGLTDKEARQYSLLRAIRALATGDHKGAEFEREVHEACEARMKGRKQRGNLLVPVDVLMVKGTGLQKRDLNAGTGSQGGFLVGTDHRADSFIELLRNRMAVAQWGATVLSGLEGNVEIPKQTGGATAKWVTEGEDGDESQATFGQVAMTPKGVIAYSEVTRRLLQQAAPDVEMLIRNDLTRTIALAVDAAALNGSGLSGQPTGVLQTNGINTKDYGSALDWAAVVGMETECAADNADIGTLGYIFNAVHRGSLKTTPKFTNTGNPIWENGVGGDGMVNGYRALCSNQMPSEKALFGNAADLIIGEWGVMDMLVNPYAKDTSGGVRLTVYQDVDVAVRHPESFCMAYT